LQNWSKFQLLLCHFYSVQASGVGLCRADSRMWCDCRSKRREQ
jgi:hypothetical protein